ncbi:response regulator transcription factor [Achromobacter denitrificans]|uniref:helix-turn-helix transcriptional regulator n=1 Tax=Achromobacter denitrificans TaxID=32002 RepID=UPI000788C90E|nr:response regulator transcription factor [Achromobacter denitrificans]MBV2160416.1 response regulator transcription factor [Achromobacter denitrificans]MDF3851116.1 response regulator transcription factor [Achromobacter denitrificans]MDF3861035.1 response regulator transcription factor [Achromobacter denitrificans]MDF3943443.1 response regulator transcription factor [Achromobacter denitrificans]OLU04448.1 LuxR family transcriptional regulator [Achromobacter denitrificans]
MTTVLIEDYALLRVAIQHVLERVRNADDILAISPAHLLNMSSSINRPVELLVVGCSGLAEQDVGLLSQSMAFFMPRLVLVLYSVLDQGVMAACARAGVAGYLPKASNPDALAAAVSLVLAGGECYPQPVARPPGAAHAPTQELRELTQRQEEILQLLVQGKTMREIGEQVGISVATVKSHARTLYWKLNARNQAEAAYIAVQMGLVRNGGSVPTPRPEPNDSA